MLFTDTITIYNYYQKQDGSECWNRTVVHGVQWSQETEKTVSNGKIDIAKYVDVTFPITSLKKYVPSNEYNEMKFEDAIAHFTLNESDNMDIIVLSELDIDIVKLSDFRKQYYCVTVASVADNTNRDRLQHIGVVAK
ncbi:hypothetical protein ACTQ6A_14240 [Lachnospiraceae bacterium LCP25S3_G4]